jgi:glycosyltransferase involved in cell wall biosynthesis
MRILFIVIEQPYPPRSGADLRNWQNISAAVGVAETAVLFLTAVEPGVSQPPLRLARWQRLDDRPPHLIWHPPQPRTPLDLDYAPAALPEIERTLRSFRPDVVVLGHTQLYALAERIRAAGAALVVDMHNVESDLYRQLVSPRVPLKYLWRRALGLGVRGIQAVERELARQAQQVWLCSAKDRERLETVIGGATASLRVVPNGLPAERLRAQRARQAPSTDRRPRLLFLGHLAYPPNVQAAYFLCRSLAPRLARLPERPELVLAGRQPTRKLRRMAEKAGATLIADPREVDPLLREADIMLVPLGNGGGTRIKVLEALGAGLPVVATPRAVEGLELADGREVFLARSAAAFERQLVRLLREPELYRAASAAALAAVARSYDPERIAATVAGALGELAPGQGALLPA